MNLFPMISANHNPLRSVLSTRYSTIPGAGFGGVGGVVVAFVSGGGVFGDVAEGRGVGIAPVKEKTIQ